MLGLVPYDDSSESDADCAALGPTTEDFRSSINATSHDASATHPAASPHESRGGSLPARQTNASQAEDAAGRPPSILSNTHAPQVRVRSFPHVAGNYPAHVYIPVPAAKYARSDLNTFFSQMKARVDGLTPVVDSVGAKRALGGAPPPSDVQDGYHLSLSRSVPITFDQIDALVGSLHRLLAPTTSFTVKMAGPCVFVNDQRTRTFLALGLQSGAEQACSIIRLVDAAFQGLGLQPFHQEPDPHVSIAWVVGDAVGAVEEAVQQLASDGADQQLCAAAGVRGGADAPGTLEQASGGGRTTPFSVAWSCKVHKVLCRVGQRDHVVWSAGGTL